MSQASSAGWHFTIGGQQYGPIDLDELRQRVAGGQVTTADLVWQEGMANWQSVASLPHLFPAAPVAAVGYAAHTPLGYAAPTYHNTAVMEYAGFWWRFLAWIIDFIITNIAAVVVAFPVGMAIGLTMGAGGVTQSTAENVGRLIGVIVGWLYYALMESSAQQGTLGKMACGLIVTDMNGNRISFGRATGRHFAKFISAIIIGIGFIMAGFTERKQGLHDMIASTLIIKKR